MRSLLVLSLFVCSSAFAHGGHDGSDIAACKGVTDVCMTKGFEPGDHKKNGKGLWMECVHKLAKGETVEGVTGVSKESAQSCADAAKAMRGDKHHKM
jgi:hypothetical protein